MPIFNYKAKEIIAKIVFYGPGLCGKTTSLQVLHQETIPERKGELYFLATETDQTIYFELVPLYVGEINNFKLRFQVYTVPGQVKYNNTRKAVLQGVDAIVFVADSQRSRRQANQRSLENLKYNLKGGYNLQLEDIPMVFEYNKRDMPDLLSIDELDRDLNPGNAPSFETVAICGDGVLDAFEEISSLAIANIEERLAQLDQKNPSTAAFRGVQKKIVQSLNLLPQAKSQEPQADIQFGGGEEPDQFEDIQRSEQVFEVDRDTDDGLMDDDNEEDLFAPKPRDDEKSLSYADIFAASYQDGDVIFREGESGDTMFFIEEGRVRIVGSYKQTKKVLAIYNKGDFFGEMALFGGKKRSATAVAIGVTRLLPVTRDGLSTQIGSRPDIAIALLETLSNRIRNDTSAIGRLANQNKELRQRLIQARDTMKQLMEQNKRLRQMVDSKQ